MKAPKRKIMRLLKISAAIFFIGIVVFILRSLYYHKPVLSLFHTSSQIGHYNLDLTSNMYILSQNGDQYLSVDIPKFLQDKSKKKCVVSDNKKKPSLCWQWENTMKIEVLESVSEDNMRCYNIVWTSLSNDYKPMDCLRLSDYNWYGGGALRSQQWPLQENSISLHPYISSNLNLDKTHPFGSVIERYWINSNGVGIVVDNSVPLYVSLNNEADNKLCFMANNGEGSIYPNMSQFPILKYSVCKASNVKKVHKYLSRKFFDLPVNSPDTTLMLYPKWSTFSQFRRNVTQRDVLTLVNLIQKNGFSSSQIDIGEGYERGIGDFNFNDKKFPNAHQMIGEFRENKFKVITSVNPFIGNGSLTYPVSSLPLNLTINSKSVSLLDLTDRETFKSSSSYLVAIKTDHLIETFKFHYGEAKFLTSMGSVLQTKSVLHNPCEYTTKYVEVAQKFGSGVIVKSAFQSQKYPVYVEISERSSTWSKDNGLPSLIPTVITYGLLGYPFVIPGPIGGLTQTFNKTTHLPVLPDRDLYIRWLQLAAYLPVMEFSVAPWQYDDEVMKIAKEYILIHENKVLPILLHASKESQINGSPLIRPLWWIAPKDDTALKIDCEFLVGDDLLVAPILEPHVTMRDVYLPEGSQWEDHLKNTHHEGGQWLTEYSADITQIPTFTRLKTLL